jgi:acetyl esterase/lipase
MKCLPLRRFGAVIFGLLAGFLPFYPAPLGAASAPAVKPGPTILTDIPYPGAAKDDRRRSLDLYLPAKRGEKLPLLIFVHGGFWLLSDDNYRIGPALAEALVKDGIAVALLRYRLAPGASYAAQAEDIAAGISLLVRSAERYGYESGRIFLSGHSAGAHLAALVALDGKYLAKQGLASKALAGMVLLSGLYDLAPNWSLSENQKVATEKAIGRDPAVLKQASPTRHARADAPPFLILSAENDFTGLSVDAKKFADALSKAGHQHVERWIVPERDHFTLTQLGDRNNEARLLFLEFLKVAPLPPEYKILVDAKRRWHEPPFSTVPFREHPKLVRSYPVDQRLVLRMVEIYTSVRYELREWPLETFHAIDLFDWLEALPANQRGAGNYLVTTNIRNEKQFWHRTQIEPYKPVIVIGLDDEKNLFRLGVFYRAQREYSWKTGPQPPMMARPLGGFIHFMKEPPAEIALQAAHFGLTEKSFRLVADDPLAPLKQLRKDLYEVVTFRNGCVYCHTLQGIGSQSHHVTAASGARHGGLALALEAYPPAVWRAFVFDQNRVAKKIGASPNLVAESARQALYDLVNKSRESNSVKQ